MDALSVHPSALMHVRVAVNHSLWLLFLLTSCVHGSNQPIISALLILKFQFHSHLIFHGHILTHTINTPEGLHSHWTFSIDAMAMPLAIIIHLWVSSDDCVCIH